MNRSTKPHRPRGRGPGGRSGGRRNQGRQQNNNRNNAGSEARIRGNAKQNLDKFLGLAKDSVAAGDRVTAENYYQHADHYFRVVQEVDTARAARTEQRKEHAAETTTTPAPEEEAVQGLPSGAIETTLLDPTLDEIADGNTQVDDKDVVEASPGTEVKAVPEVNVEAEPKIKKPAPRRRAPRKPKKEAAPV